METVEASFYKSFSSGRPHSLGQSVEWKLGSPSSDTSHLEIKGPTRWGNQLNGNRNSYLPEGGRQYRPHSLGQSVEWKLAAASVSKSPALGPTRWGNQLNGNWL